MEQVKHLTLIADRLEQNNLLTQINQLTEQLQMSLTDNATQKWLTSRQEEITAHRRELLNAIRQAIDIWKKAASSIREYEQGCTAAQNCIAGRSILCYAIYCRRSSDWMYCRHSSDWM